MSELERFASRYEMEAAELRRRLVEAMVLGAAADGDFEPSESDAILEQVGVMPEFAGMGAHELRESVRRAFDGLENDGLHVRLHALAAALPRYAHRVLAFRSATRVAFANGRLHRGELSMLRDMQKAFGLAEADVTRAFETAQSRADIGIDEPFEPVETYLDCLLMAAASDRHLGDEELATILAFVMSRQEFDGIEPERIREYIHEGLRRYANGGIEERLGSLADELDSPRQRETAFGLVASVVAADGGTSVGENAFLRRLREVLELDDARTALALGAGVPR